MKNCRPEAIQECPVVDPEELRLKELEAAFQRLITDAVYSAFDDMLGTETANQGLHEPSISPANETLHQPTSNDGFTQVILDNMNRQFNKIHRRFDKVDRRFDNGARRSNNTNKRLARVETTGNIVKKGMDSVNDKTDLLVECSCPDASVRRMSMTNVPVNKKTPGTKTRGRSYK